MWDPVKLTLRNFFSHKHTEFTFRTGQLVLLLGYIDGQEGADSNGAGKSALIEGITVAVTGINSKGLPKEAMIYTGERHTVVQLELKHSVTRENFIILRDIYAGSKSGVLTIMENLVPVNFDKMKRTAQEYIYEKLGITEEDFLNHYVINQDNESSFLTSTDGKQKQVISRFSNYNKLEPIIEHLEEEIGMNQGRAQKLQMDLQTCLSSINQYDETLQDLREDSEYTDRKNDLTEKLSARNKKLSDLRQSLVIAESNKEKAEKALKSLKAPKQTVTQLESQLTKIRCAKDAYEEELNAVLELKSKLAIRSGSIIKCPNCNWEFIPNDDMTPEEIEAGKEVIKEEIDRVEALIVEHKEQIELIRGHIKASELYERAKRMVEQTTNTYQSIIESCKHQEEYIKTLEADLASLKQNSNTKLITSTEAKRAEAATLQVQIEEELHTLAEELEGLKFHKFSFDKQFRTYIANKTIRTIQDKQNYYLSKFKIDLQVLINGYKLLKSGEVREKIQIFAIKNGVQRLIKALSGGQLGRAALCDVIALHKLINEASPAGGLNLLCFDEFLSALDASGQNNVIKILEESGITSIVVMHYAADTEARNKVVVRYKDEVSTIEQ